LKLGTKKKLAPLSALTLLVVIPLWAPTDSDLGQAYGFYSTWQGRLALGLLIAVSALFIHFSLHPQKGTRIERFAARHFASILFFYFAIYTAVFATLGVIAYLRFHSDVDYANFMQSFYSAARGKFFTNCLANAPHEISIFADHNSPIMFLILPIFMLLPHPSVLLVISTLILASTALLLARYLTRAVGLDRTTALCLCAAATLAPYYASQNFQGLSMEMFGPPLLILAFFLFERGEFWPFMASLLVLNSVKEQVAVVMMAFVLLSLLRRKDPRWAIGPLLLNAAMIFLSFGVVIPHFRPTGAYKLLAPDAAMSLTGQAAAYLSDPASAFRQLIEPFRLTYIYVIAATNLFFLPFLALESVFVVPSLAKNLLFVGWAANIMSKHALLLSGAMAVAVGKAIGRFAAHSRNTNRSMPERDAPHDGGWARVLAILLLASSIAHIPVWSKNIHLSKDANHDARVRLLELIPHETPIALPQNMLTRFSTRNKLYNSVTPDGLTGFDMPVDYVVIDTAFHPEHYDYEALVRKIATAGGIHKGFKLTWQSQGLHLFERWKNE